MVSRELTNWFMVAVVDVNALALFVANKITHETLICSVSKVLTPLAVLMAFGGSSLVVCSS